MCGLSNAGGQSGVRNPLGDHCCPPEEGLDQSGNPGDGDKRMDSSINE